MLIDYIIERENVLKPENCAVLSVFMKNKNSNLTVIVP
jgi:hypothetical protein